MPKSVIKTDRLMKPIAHFSFGIRLEDDVHIGATAGTDAARRLAGSSPGLVDMRAQTERMFENFAISLEVLGARLDQTVAIRTYITDWRDLGVYEDAYQRWFGNVAVSHAILGTPGFPLPQATVEAELIAATAPSARKFFVSAPLDASGHVTAPGDIASQTEQTLRDLQAQLRARGLDLSDVVQLNVALADVRHQPVFDEVCARLLQAPYPARSITGAASPHVGALVQIEAVALPGGGQPLSVDEPSTAISSIATRAGDYVYLSAQYGLPSGRARSADVEAQTRGAWQRITSVLRAADLGVEDVVHTTNVLTDWRSYAGFNAGYGAFAHAPYPPRATVIGGLADPGALVQIESTAHVRGRDALYIEVEG